MVKVVLHPLDKGNRVKTEQLTTSFPARDTESDPCWGWFGSGTETMYRINVNSHALLDMFAIRIGMLATRSY